MNRNNTGRQISFSWDICYDCNYRCPYCWWHGQWHHLKLENKILSVKEIIQSWRRIYDRYGEVKIDILGGEPFIYPCFTDIIRELSQLHSINIATNLSCNIEHVTKEWNPSRIKINPTFHPLFANLASFKEKARILKEVGFVQSITYLAYPPQVLRLNYYKEIFQKEGIGLAILTFWGRYNGRDYPEAYSEEEKRIINPDLAKRNGEYFQTSPIQSPRGKLCYAGSLSVCIHPDGKTLRCGSGGDETIGNFWDERFKLLDAPVPCTSDICHCNEWAFLLQERVDDGNNSNSATVEILRENKLENTHKKISDVNFSWEICYTCNYRCPYCGRWNDASNNDLFLSPEEWKSIWEMIYEKYGSCSMFISGAEPTTYPHFFDIVQEISRMHTITVCTNFSWIAEEVINRDLNPENIKFTPTFHSLFANFNDFLKKAIRLRDWIKDKTVFFVGYSPQMLEVEYYKRSMNENGIDFCIVPLRGSKNEQMEVICSKDEKETIASLTDMCRDEFDYLAQNISPKGKLCMAGFRYAIIKPTGKIFPCSQNELPLGHIQNCNFNLLNEPSICPSAFCPYESYNLVERYNVSGIG